MNGLGLKEGDMAEIDINDIVCVNFNCARYTLSHKAKVCGRPVATGDSWIFEDLENGKIHYVSEGCTITLLEKANDGPF